MKTTLQKIKAFTIKHKVWTAVIALVVIIGGYIGYQKMTSTSTDPRYFLSTVQKGTVISTVSASGQVSAQDELNITPKVSGEITWISIKAGDKVGNGGVLMTLDNTTAAQSLADAKKTLAADQLQYQKDTAEAPVSYQNDLNTLLTDKNNLASDYNNTYNDLTSTYLDSSNVISGAENAIYNYDFDTKKTQTNADVLFNLF